MAHMTLAATLGQVQWTQTARFPDGSLSLLKDMEPLQMAALQEGVSATDPSKTYLVHVLCTFWSCSHVAVGRPLTTRSCRALGIKTPTSRSAVETCTDL